MGLQPTLLQVPGRCSISVPSVSCSLAFTLGAVDFPACFTYRLTDGVHNGCKAALHKSILRFRSLLSSKQILGAGAAAQLGDVAACVAS